jgi:purine nucleosidase
MPMAARPWAMTLAVALLCAAQGGVAAQEAAPASQDREKIIIDTDIGDDIDDAFAVALALRSRELEILGISTAFGDTEGRARILDRMLGEAGRPDIPVAVGIATSSTASTAGQFRYGRAGRFARATHPNAIEFISDQIHRHPGEVTLVAIGPLDNVGALIDKDPQTFRKLKRVVLMGGWVEAVPPDYGSAPAVQPAAEYNIAHDIKGAQKLFLSGVPLYVMPLDSTRHLFLTEVNRQILFSQDTALTNALMLLYHQSGIATPVLYDPMTLAFMLDPGLCPVRPLRIRVDNDGLMRVESGSPNAQVCLHSDADAFFRFYMQRLLDQ